MSKKQLKYDEAYMRMALEWAKLSHCERKQVGALIVKERMIISDGFNGTPTGFENCCEEEGNTKWYVLHAEANAILKLARDGESGNGADLFCTHAPCINCAKLIYGAGVRKVYYRESYRDTLGTDFLTKCNIEVEKYISKSVDLQVV